MLRLESVVLAALAVAVSSSPLTAWAQEGSSPAAAPTQAAPAQGTGDSGNKAPAGKKGKGWKKLAEGLGLTDDQTAKFKDARKAHREAVKPLREKLKDGVKTLAGQIKDKAGDKDVQTTLDQMTEARKAVQAENERYQAALAGFLTPTQRGKALLFVMKRLHRGGGHGGGTGGGDDGGDDAGE